VIICVLSQLPDPVIPLSINKGSHIKPCVTVKYDVDRYTK